MRPYLPDQKLTEDPLDGTHPPKHPNPNVNRSHKKGARQDGKEQTRREANDA